MPVVLVLPGELSPLWVDEAVVPAGILAGLRLVQIREPAKPLRLLKIVHYLALRRGCSEYQLGFVLGVSFGIDESELVQAVVENIGVTSLEPEAARDAVHDQSEQLVDIPGAHHRRGDGESFLEGAVLHDIAHAMRPISDL